MQLLNLCVFMTSSQILVLLCIPQSPGHRAPLQLQSLWNSSGHVCLWSLGTRLPCLFFLTTVRSTEKDGVMCLPLCPQAELWLGYLPALSVVLGSDLLTAGSDKAASQDGSFPRGSWGPYHATPCLNFLPSSFLFGFLFFFFPRQDFSI